MLSREPNDREIERALRFLKAQAARVGGPEPEPEPVRGTDARKQISRFTKINQMLVAEAPQSEQPSNDPDDLERLGNLYVDIAKELELGGFDKVLDCGEEVLACATSTGAAPGAGRAWAPGSA